MSPHKDKLGKVSKKSPYNSEKWEECATSMCKLPIALLMVKPNTSKGLKPLPLIALEEFEDEIPKELIPKVPLPIKMVLEESPYEVDQATSDTSFKYDEFEFSCNEYVEIFNVLIRPMRATPKDPQQLLQIKEETSA